MNPLTQVLATIGVVLLAIVLFIGTYVLNKRTKKPEGCENLEENCSGCSLVGCSHHPGKKDENKESEENK